MSLEYRETKDTINFIKIVKIYPSLNRKLANIYFLIV